jgi:hypothetical protein
VNELPVQDVDGESLTAEVANDCAELAHVRLDLVGGHNGGHGSLHLADGLACGWL